MLSGFWGLIRCSNSGKRMREERLANLRKATLESKLQTGIERVGADDAALLGAQNDATSAGLVLARLRARRKEATLLDGDLQVLDARMSLVLVDSSIKRSLNDTDVLLTNQDGDLLLTETVESLEGNQLAKNTKSEKKKKKPKEQAETHVGRFD